MPEHDLAVQLSLRYLAVIETRLQITWNEQEQPVCIIDWIGDESIQLLREELVELLGGPLGLKARQATVDYGKEHIQTVGFGHAPNFDQFVKLGFIYGERLVLWDVISSRLLAHGNSGAQLKSVLAQTACNLLLLRPVVERGGLVILPHPVLWSTIAADLDANLRAQGNKSAATLGISMAFAAIEEGLPLHPYTLLVEGSPPTANTKVSQQESVLYSPENHIFQQAIGTLLRDQRVAYLQDARAADFYNVVARHGELQRALRKHFIASLKGLSPQQTAAEISRLTDDLIALIGKQNTAVIDYKAEGVDATVKFMLTSLTSISFGLSLLETLTLAGTLAIPLTTAIRKWAKKPEKNVIVQVFQSLMETESTPQTLDYSPVLHQAIENVQIHPGIRKLYDQFMSFGWTEERHHFLKTLSPEVARALLKTLGPDDLEIIVNYRRFQQDYIGDYLEYISQLDKDVYWEHVGKTFESDEGLLVYDIDSHIETMASSDMPMEVWMQLLDSLLGIYSSELTNKDYGYPLECFPEIVHFQTESATDFGGKRNALIVWFKSIENQNQEAIVHFLKKSYSDELPQWFVEEADLENSTK